MPLDLLSERLKVCAGLDETDDTLGEVVTEGDLFATVSPMDRALEKAFDMIEQLQAELADMREQMAAVPRYRGRHADAETYLAGDLVNTGGSTFICLRDHPATVPQHGAGDTPEWACFARRGRDAAGRNR